MASSTPPPTASTGPVQAPVVQAQAAKMPRSLLPMSFGAIDLQSIYHQRLETLLGHVNRVAEMKERQDKADKERRKKAKAEALASGTPPPKAVGVASSKDLNFRRYRSSDQDTLQTFVQTTPKTYAGMKFIPTDFDAMARLFPKHELIVCEIGDEIAGTIGYSQKQVRVFGLECTSIFGFDLRINPRFWRRGIGFHLIRRTRKHYNEVNPHWVYGFVLEENVASLHMNREQCILTTMRWLGWSTDQPFPDPDSKAEVDNDGDNDDEQDDTEPDYSIRMVPAQEALTILTDTFALHNFFPLDMESTILKSPFYHGTYVITNSRGAFASVSLWDKGGVTKVELNGVRIPKRLSLWGLCYSGFDSDADGVAMLMTLIRHVQREARAKGVGYLSTFMPSEMPIAQELQRYATANALWYCIGVYFRDMYFRDSKRKHGTDPFSAPLVNFGSSFFSDPRELLF